MPGKPFAEMEKIRKWIRMALKHGATSPRQVLEYIEQNSNDFKAPSLPTIGNAMKAEGWSPKGSDWERVKEKG